jgi:hypothetical protein
MIVAQLTHKWNDGQKYLGIMLPTKLCHSYSPVVDPHIMVRNDTRISALDRPQFQSIWVIVNDADFLIRNSRQTLIKGPGER